jgi:hypothetical protein
MAQGNKDKQSKSNGFAGNINGFFSVCNSIVVSSTLDYPRIRLSSAYKMAHNFLSNIISFLCKLNVSSKGGVPVTKVNIAILLTHISYSSARLCILLCQTYKQLGTD